MIFLTTIPGAYLLMMGTIGAYALDFSRNVGIILAAIFVVIYLWRGGFKSVVKTDVHWFMQKTMKELPLNEIKFNGSCVALPLVQKLVCEFYLKNL